MRRTSLVAAVALACGLAVVPTVAARAATDTVTELPMKELDDMAVDGVHGRVFVSGWNTVAVRDFTGAEVARISPGFVAGIALSPDSSRLYLALDGFWAIAAYDTTTLTEVARYPTGDSTCPQWLSATGSAVWFGYGCSSAGKIGLLDLSGETPVVTLDKAPEGAVFARAPRVKATADGTRLLAASTVTSPSSLYSFPVTGGTLGTPAVADLGNLQDFALTPDGAEVLTASTSADSHARYAVADLSPAGSVGAALPSPASAAVTGAFSATGTNAATGLDVRVYDAEGGLVRSYELGARPLPGGLAFAPDGATLLAVSTFHPDYLLRLHVLHDPTKPPATLTLAYPTAPQVGTAFTLNGTLNGPGEGAVVRVTRSSRFGTVALPDVVTGAGGAFAITDTVPKRGGYTYTATFEGDDAWARASAGRAFGVKGLVPSLSISTDKTAYPFHATAAITARLATWSNSRRLTVTASSADFGTQMLRTADADANGYVKVPYTITRSTAFTVTYYGDDVYEPRQVSVTRSSYAGLRATLSGYYATSGAYRVYRRTVNPVVHANVDPDRYNACLVFEAQAYTSGAWRTFATTCLRTSYSGEVYAGLYGTHPVNVPHRIRVTFQGDTRNLRTVGPWQYLRFT